MSSIDTEMERKCGVDQRGMGREGELHYSNDDKSRAQLPVPLSDRSDQLIPNIQFHETESSNAADNDNTNVNKKEHNNKEYNNNNNNNNNSNNNNNNNNNNNDNHVDEPCNDKTLLGFFGLKFNKTATIVDDTYANINTFRYSAGARIRKTLYKIEDTIGPIVKKVIPNFIIAHYVYILFWTIFSSIVIYPEKNMEYIDVLMFTAGASTQGGLATLQLNDIKLYQQIALYVTCMFTTPVFIHGSLTFLRLYWYEKRFDNIKEASIKQYKMRRNKTIANLRSETLSARTFTNRTGNFDSHNASEGLTTRMERFEKNLNQNNGEDDNNSQYPPTIDSDYSTDIYHNSKFKDLKPEIYHPNAENYNKNKSYQYKDNDINHLSEPSDDSDDDGLRNRENAIHDENEDDTSNDFDASEELAFDGKNDDNSEHYNTTEHTPNIKFAELPKPNKFNKKRDLDPRDLYMSISVLQRNPKQNDDEEGPALHIKSPMEVEEEGKRRLPGHREKHRKLLRARKLQRMKNKGEEIMKNGKDLSPQETDNLQNDVSKLDSTSTFDIVTKNPKTIRSLSVPAFANGKMQSPDSSFFNTNNDHDASLKDESLNHVTTNDQKINEKLHALNRSHTIHVSDISKKLFMPFDNENATKNDHPASNKQRRASFFGRTFTGLSKRRRMSDSSELSDEELAEYYSDGGHPAYLSWNPTVGRNSKFITLSSEQKYEMGGVEYQAMRLLSKLLVVYYVGLHIVCIVLFLPFINTKTEYEQQLREVGVSPTWWAFFTSMSSFNDLGYTLNPTSMMLFAQNAYVLIISAFFVILGNTGFPIFLRLFIWLLKFFTRPLTITHDSLSFLLEHPRRCFTLLFPSGPTWWLTAVLLILNGFDWILFIILDYGSAALSYLPKGYQILAGLFQSISTRTAGYNVVNLATLHPAIQVSYMVMMYISVLPLAISIRRTNVYEEQSLGVYERDEEEDHEHSHKIKYIGAHLRKQLSFDLWFLFLAIFIICIVEGGRLKENNPNFSIFQVMFEVTSAYGTVGLSLGYPDSNASFCGQFSKLSKLVIIAVLIRGRHRGLPNSIDRAIMLSDEKLNLRDDLEAYHAMRRTNTVGSDMTSLFPNISRAATSVSRMRNGTIDRAPTISENLRKGIIPWKDIAKKTGKTFGHVVSNLLTVSGTSVNKYSRQMTKYNTYEQPYQRSRATTHHSRRGSSDEYDDYRGDYFGDDDNERIPLYHIRDRDTVPNSKEPQNTNFFHHSNNTYDVDMHGNEMKEGTSSSESGTNHIFNKYGELGSNHSPGSYR